MATARRALGPHDPSSGASEAGREIFEACRNGDLNKVKKLISQHNVNAKDTAGRKSSPLHFAAGLTLIFHFFSSFSRFVCFYAKIIILKLVKEKVALYITYLLSILIYSYGSPVVR